MADNTITISSEQYNQLEAAKKAADQLNLSLEQREVIVERILANEFSSVEAAKNAVAQQRQLITAENEQLAIQKEQIRQEKEKAKLQAKLQDNLLDLTSDMQKALRGEKALRNGIVNEARDLQEQIRQQFTEQSNEYDQATKLVEEAEKLQLIYDNGMGPSLANINSEIDSLASRFTGFIESMPGGKFLSDAIGLGGFAEEMKKNVLQNIAAIPQGIKAGKKPFAMLNALGKAFNATALANPYVALAAVIIGIVMAMKKLVSIAAEHEQITRETAQSIGVSTMEMKSLVDNSAELGARLPLTSAAELRETFAAMSEELGTTLLVSDDVAGSVAETAQAFGYSLDQAAKVNVALMRTGLTAAQAAEEQRDIAAEAFKNGVNQAAVIEDIANNAKVTSKFFAGDVKALKKAAIEAAKLGMSLSDMAEVANTLLDFESSISSQFEFQALTGKQVNFDLARQLALQGNIEGATKEVLRQVGDINEFNNLDVLSKQKLAEATGMSVDQLQESLALEAQRAKFGDAQVEQAKKLGISADELQNMSAEQLETKLKEAENAQILQERQKDFMNELKQALVPLGEKLLHVFNKITGVIKTLTPALKVLGVIIEIAMAPTIAAWKTFGYILDLVNGISKIFKGDFKGGIIDIGKALINFFLRPLQFVLDMIQGVVNPVLKFAGKKPINLNIADNVTKLIGVGDLAMSAGGGPIVMSPNEGTIFQGTTNDEVAMGPGVIGSAQSGNESINIMPLVNVMNEVKQVLMEIKNQTPEIRMDGAKVAEVVRVADSYRRR